jgi:signal transduction histidine kinase
VLQYRALTDASAADAEKTHRRVQEETERFAMDFNREIQNAYFNFQTEADVWKDRNWRPFTERYDYWRDKTAYPELISDFYFFETKAGTPPLRYDRERREFVVTDPNDQFDDLRSRAFDDKEFKAFLVDSYTLLLPIHDIEREIEKVILRRPTKPTEPMVAMPKRYGVLAITLNDGVIKDQLLPALMGKYFGDDEFKVAVTDVSGQPIFLSMAGEAPDATAGLFKLSPGNFIEFKNKELLDSIGVARRSNVLVDSRVESHTFNRSVSADGKTQTVKIELHDSGKPSGPMFARTADDDPAPWTLSVQHSSGSIDGYIASTLRRNLAIGFGLLFLVGVAVAAIIISSMRAKALARRQLDFVSSVSHEFRTPLAVIYSAGENLADGVAKDDLQVNRYGDLIKGEGQKLSAMVEQILEFAGARSGKQKYNFQTINVGEAINDAVEQCKPLIRERNTGVEVQIAEGLPTVEADKRALSQAIQNLVANSIKYSNGSAWLRIAVTNGDRKVRISVEDRGIGIGKDDLKQIFDPFYRAKDVVDAQIHGNGLGLSLVKRIAEAHGGRVMVESELEKGSKFTIELPQA